MVVQADKSNDDARISPVVLILLDGWGIAPSGPGNFLSNTPQPNLSDYLRQYPLTALVAPQVAGGLAKEAYRQIGSGQDSSFIPGLGGVADQPGLTELLFQAGCRQAYFAETEKLPLLVEYLAGNYHGPNIDYQTINTPLNNNYNQNVLAASHQLIDQAVRYWRHHQPDFLAINLAAWSSVARYGQVEDIIKAIIAMDKLLPKLINPIIQTGATILLTSAYGRLENLLDPLTEKINFGPSNNPVPLSIIGRLWQGQSLGEGEMATNDLNALPLSGSLRSIAPTVLALLGIERPSYLVNPLLPTSFNQ
jgi:bisphosphoglycerate-independent phosphoglycerate mutase (AlkP superfamily)